MNEVWGPYVLLYSCLTAGAYVTLVLMLVALHCEYLRKRCRLFHIILKILMKLYATVLFIPSFSEPLYGIVCSPLWQCAEMFAKVRTLLLEGLSHRDLLSRDPHCALTDGIHGSIESDHHSLRLFNDLLG